MKSDRGSWRLLRRDQLRDELVHDTYRSKGKLAEPTRCPDCGVVYSGGRWNWSTAPEAAGEERCPACQRVRDRYPAGYVVLKGDFLAGHREEVLQLARHREAKEKAEHPLERIMAVEDVEGGVQITTTDTHLARDIGEAVYSAYRGELEYHYNKEQNLLRVHWAR
ncbi:MAG: BCAM0308 family protein [Burkholderiaceae bacterium]|jgi:NMD protein affecting ribosome stability and mRNA decay|nr:BCAM0308 family protein [Burkholderiaceae bacterium]